MKKLPAPIFITIAGILTLTAAQPVLAEDTEVLSVQTENAADQNQENDLSNADVISCGAPNWRNGIIEDQTFQTQLSEYTGDVWFASYAPADGEKDVIFKIIQNEEPVETLDSLVTPSVLSYGFTKLDAISFVDYNEDGNTDILAIKTFGDIAVPVVYEGTPGSEKNFTLKTGLSVRAAAGAQSMTIAGVLDYLKTVAKEQWTAVDTLPEGTPSNFVFASGVGAWSTMMNLNQDGSFSGSFSDSDVTAGEGYSYTMYCSDFTGKFTEIKKLNDHVYSMQLTDLQLEQESGTQEIIDDCLKVYSEPYGLVPGSEFYLYVPEVQSSELPLQVPEGWSGVEYSSNDPDLLTSYILYNIEGDAPFGGYE